MLRDCRDLPTFPRFLRQVQAIDVSTQVLFEANYERICRDLGGIVVQDVHTANREELPPVQSLPEHHRIEGLNNKAKITMRKSYGFHTYRVLELTLYHSLGKLPEPESTHDFF